MEYEIKISVTEEQLKNLLSMALDNIDTWANDVVAVNDCEWVRNNSDADHIILGKGVYITTKRPHRGKKKFILTRKRIKTALSKSEWFRWSSWGELEADMILQKALFGDVVFREVEA